MKNLINLCLILASAFIMSCNQDACKDKVCGDFGTCETTTGNCDCDMGYEQDAAGICNTAMRTKFLGTWVASDSCSSSGTSSYTVTSASASDVSKFNIVNFWDSFNAAVMATVDGSRTFKIERQQPDNDGFYVESTGTPTLNEAGNMITIKYKVTNEANGVIISTDNCTATFTK